MLTTQLQKNLLHRTKTIIMSAQSVLNKQQQQQQQSFPLSPLHPHTQAHSHCHTVTHSHTLNQAYCSSLYSVNKRKDHHLSVLKNPLCFTFPPTLSFSPPPLSIYCTHHVCPNPRSVPLLDNLIFFSLLGK